MPHGILFNPMKTTSQLFCLCFLVVESLYLLFYPVPMWAANNLLPIPIEI